MNKHGKTRLFFLPSHYFKAVFEQNNSCLRNFSLMPPHSYTTLMFLLSLFELYK